MQRKPPESAAKSAAPAKPTSQQPAKICFFDVDDTIRSGDSGEIHDSKGLKNCIDQLKKQGYQVVFMSKRSSAKEIADLLQRGGISSTGIQIYGRPSKENFFGADDNMNLPDFRNQFLTKEGKLQNIDLVLKLYNMIQSYKGQNPVTNFPNLEGLELETKIRELYSDLKQLQKMILLPPEGTPTLDENSIYRGILDEEKMRKNCGNLQKNSPFAEMFREVSFEGELSIKRNIKFLKAAEILKASGSAENCVWVDDSPEDAVAASRFGMLPVLAPILIDIKTKAGKTENILQSDFLNAIPALTTNIQKSKEQAKFLFRHGPLSWRTKQWNDKKTLLNEYYKKIFPSSSAGILSRFKLSSTQDQLSQAGDYILRENPIYESLPDLNKDNLDAIKNKLAQVVLYELYDFGASGPGSQINSIPSLFNKLIPPDIYQWRIDALHFLAKNSPEKLLTPIDPKFYPQMHPSSLPIKKDLSILGAVAQHQDIRAFLEICQLMSEKILIDKLIIKDCLKNIEDSYGAGSVTGSNRVRVAWIKEILNQGGTYKANMLKYLIDHDEGFNAEFFKSKEWKELRVELITAEKDHPNYRGTNYQPLFEKEIDIAPDSYTPEEYSALYLHKRDFFKYLDEYRDKKVEVLAAKQTAIPSTPAADTTTLTAAAPTSTSSPQSAWQKSTATTTSSSPKEQVKMSATRKQPSPQFAASIPSTATATTTLTAAAASAAKPSFEAATAIYKSIDGKTTYSPDEAKNMSQAKNPDGTALQWRSAAADYCAESTDGKTARVEMIGKRDAQEDRVVVETIPANEIQGVQQGSVGTLLANTFTALHDNIKPRYVAENKMEKKPGSFADGTCAIACAVQGDQVHVANMGDSTAFIVVLDKDNKVTLCNRVNNLHNIAVASEQVKIKEALRGTEGEGFLQNPHYLKKGRVLGSFFGGLNISRTIGDFEHDLKDEASGQLYCLISHSPEIYDVQKVIIPEGGKAFLITACDGLTEGVDKDQTYANSDAKNANDVADRKKRDEDYVKAGVEAAIAEKKNNPAEIAAFLAQRAIQGDEITAPSRDNISVVVNQIKPDSKDIQLVAVFDGHDGSSVAAECQARFVETFKQQCELQKIQAARAVPVAPVKPLEQAAPTPTTAATSLADTLSTTATTATTESTSPASTDDLPARRRPIAHGYTPEGAAIRKAAERERKAAPLNTDSTATTATTQSTRSTESSNTTHQHAQEVLRRANAAIKKTRNTPAQTETSAMQPNTAAAPLKPSAETKPAVKPAKIRTLFQETQAKSTQTTNPQQPSSRPKR